MGCGEGGAVSTGAAVGVGGVGEVGAREPEQTSLAIVAEGLHTNECGNLGSLKKRKTNSALICI